MEKKTTENIVAIEALKQNIHLKNNRVINYVLTKIYSFI